MRTPSIVSRLDISPHDVLNDPISYSRKLRQRQKLDSLDKYYYDNGSDNGGRPLDRVYNNEPTSSQIARWEARHQAKLEERRKVIRHSVEMQEVRGGFYGGEDPYLKLLDANVRSCLGDSRGEVSNEWLKSLKNTLSRCRHKDLIKAIHERDTKSIKAIVRELANEGKEVSNSVYYGHSEGKDYDLGLVDENMTTALMVASIVEDCELTKLLFDTYKSFKGTGGYYNYYHYRQEKAYPRPNAEDKDGDTALGIALSKGNSDIVKVFIANRFSLEGQSQKKQSTFFRNVISRGNLEGVKLICENLPPSELKKLLLEEKEILYFLFYGAEKNKEDSFSQERCAILRYLINQGVDPKKAIKVDKDEWETPYDMAKNFKNCQEISAILGQIKDYQI